MKKQTEVEVSDSTMVEQKVRPLKPGPALRLPLIEDAYVDMRWSSKLTEVQWNHFQAVLQALKPGLIHEVSDPEQHFHDFQVDDLFCRGCGLPLEMAAKEKAE